jgi:hypothetical protein
MFSYDTIYDYLARSTGRTIETDYVFNNFWKNARKIYGYSDFDNNQRCLGNQNAHYYSFNYTYQYFKNYKNHNRFAYVHSSGAHEDSGNVKTIDSDLSTFLANMLKLYDENQENVLILLMSDHGRQIKGLDFDPRGIIDHLHPFTFFIMNSRLHQEINRTGIMEINSKALMSRFDLHLTLKTVAQHPYGGISTEEYNKSKEEYKRKGFVSLLHEKIKDDRNCEDIGVGKRLCLCGDFNDIDENNSDDENASNGLMELSERFMLMHKEESKECEENIVQKIENIKRFEILLENEDFVYIYQADLLLINNITATAKARYSTTVNFIDKILPRRHYPLAYFPVTNPKFFLQVESVEFNSPCGIPYCICKH